MDVIHIELKKILIRVMKHINEHLSDSINEAREVAFRVAFNDAKDKHGSPISATILVDRADKNEFRSFLSQEIDNIFFRLVE